MIWMRNNLLRVEKTTLILTLLKDNQPTQNRTFYLRVGKLTEHGRQPIVINVAVGLYGHVKDMNWLILNALQ